MDRESMSKNSYYDSFYGVPQGVVLGLAVKIQQVCKRLQDLQCFINATLVQVRVQVRDSTPLLPTELNYSKCNLNTH